MAVKISSHLWGQIHGKAIYLFKLENSSGAYVELTNYGATLVSLVVPDGQQVLEHVIVGFPNLEGYLQDTCYVGATIGRYANRISGGSFKIGAEVFHLDKNDGKNSNHGGENGFDKTVFEANIDEGKLVMTLESPDGSGGFPGNLSLKVTYKWNENNELLISYDAVTDKPTIANFTNHAYFNLSGFKQNINEHRLVINAWLVLHAWSDHTASGAILPAGPRAFNNNKVRDKFQVLEDGVKGLNLFYIIDKEKYEEPLAPAAKLIDEKSGRTLEVYTDYPGVFLYTGDYLFSNSLTHTGDMAKPLDALCLECQHYPDSINHSNFPQAVLKPGEIYHQNILFKFGLS